LDLAGTIDETALYLFNKKEKEIIEMDYLHEEKLTESERFVKELDSKTGGSLKLTLLNPSASVWTLIAGGGASVV